MVVVENGSKARAALMNQNIFNRRKRFNSIGLALSIGAMTIGMLFLLWILSILL